MKNTKPSTGGLSVLFIVSVLGVPAPCGADDIYLTITTDANDGICSAPLNFRAHCETQSCVRTPGRVGIRSK